MSDLTFKEKKLIRMQRFGGGAETGTVGAAEVLKKLEEEKQKRLERAAKFGIETDEMAVDKK